MKCSCCGSEDLVEKRISGYPGGGGCLGGFRLHLDSRKCADINKARVCTVCGNIMPFVEPERLKQHNSERWWDKM